jgi:hypothetical protein
MSGRPPGREKGVGHGARSVAAGGQDEGKGHLVFHVEVPQLPLGAGSLLSAQAGDFARQHGDRPLACLLPSASHSWADSRTSSSVSSLFSRRCSTVWLARTRRTGRSCGGGTRGTKGPQQWNLGGGCGERSYDSRTPRGTAPHGWSVRVRLWRHGPTLVRKLASSGTRAARRPPTMGRTSRP